MIKGVGIDSIEIARIGRCWERFGERFLKRVFTSEERATLRSGSRLISHLAGKFAAKEATLKVLGTGIGNSISWRDIQILENPGGRPRIILKRKASQQAQKLGIDTLSVSITHDREKAIAVVIGEGG